MKTLPTNILENLAKKFRCDQLQINITEPIHIKSAIRKLNILTVYRSLSKNYSGLSIKTKGSDKKFMLINSNMTRGRQHFTVAHEFFHLFYEEEPIPHLCKYQEEQSCVSEKNANLFASILLMPEEGILSFFETEELKSKNISMAKIIRMEQYYQVSRSSLLCRLKSLKLISDVVYVNLKKIPVKESVKQIGLDPSLYEEGNENLVIGDFGEKAKSLFDLEKISEGHYKELINLISNEKD